MDCCHYCSTSGPDCVDLVKCRERALLYLKSQREMYEGAIEGWRSSNAALEKELAEARAIIKGQLRLHRRASCG